MKEKLKKKMILNSRKYSAPQSGKRELNADDAAGI